MSIPKLRFKEFDGDWLLDTLENQINFLAGYAFDSKSMSNDVQAYQLIKMSNVYQNQLDLTRNPSYWSVLESKNEKFLLSKGDIVLTLTGTVGKTDYGYNVEITENNKFLLNQRLVRLRGKEQVSLSKFIQYRISTDRFFYHFFNSSKGGTGNQSNVSIEDLKLLELPFPKLKEQTKIASFLSAVDEKISQLTRKHELLSQYKQGMMQKLFSQQIRFKADDGSEFGEWALSKLANYINEFKSTSKIQDEYEVLTSSRKGLIRQAEYFEGSRLVDRENIGYNIIQPNQITYRSRSDDGLFFFNLNRLGITGIISTYYPVFTMKNSDNRFFHEYLNFYKQEYVKYAVGTSQLVLSLNELRNMKFKIPCLEEQTKIANFLSAIDQKIEVVAQQIEQTKQWKKGLLQQMFV
ncbi:hypothetical protein F908_00681 [Acinetobacter sp. NIPH 284]|uniref:restriction endonuclease subunit S n=1 Tax=Acinetobacter sp. NIPH 284 TaxID=1217704 RepID=UPI0002D0230C|nr:restriction endonuclease subunit S [Acinetobacter sp. NIPH 284]ENW83783.1 hypothetical protein F908_00681 [Acinetobacter sp. NIPH 284]